MYSASREDMIKSAHMLDRLLWNEFYMLPNWFINEHRIAYFVKFKMPNNLPKYYEATDYILKTWSIK